MQIVHLQDDRATPKAKTRGELMHILLVEDNTEVADSMLRAFDLRGWEYTHAATLADARREIALNVAEDEEKTNPSIDVAIIDLNLPDGLGIELLPTTFSSVVYSGLPGDAERMMQRGEAPTVPVFSKGRPGLLFDWLEEQAAS